MNKINGLLLKQSRAGALEVFKNIIIIIFKIFLFQNISK
jgi:hypothetical protein